MPSSARMADVAKLAGVSNMTVSRVLNKHPNVSPDVRRRVLAATEQLRYQPNELARSLRDRKSRQIGIIVPYLYDPFFATCAHIIGSVAKQHTYSVVLSTTNEDPRDEWQEVNQMMRRNVEGLVIIPADARNDPSQLKRHSLDRVPIVTLDRPVEGSPFDSVLVENERGAYAGTEHLLRGGRRRIAYVGLAAELYTMTMRERGYVAAMNKARLRPEVLHVSGTLDDARALVSRIMLRRSPPNAFFCSNNLVTQQVLHGLQAMELHPPKTVALVGFDDFEAADLVRPGVTVLRQPVEQLAKTAAELLFGRLINPRGQQPPKQVVLPVELVVRGSCGARE